MNQGQIEHLKQILELFKELTAPKYEKGAIEHNSNLWEYTDEQLDQFELEEIIDLATYRLTRILKRNGSNA